MDSNSVFKRFRIKYGHALELYAEAVNSCKPETLISISRKSPRLIDFINADPTLPDIDIANRISEKALPFIEFRELLSGTVMITDDTLIHGSTFNGIVAPLNEKLADLVQLVVAKSETAEPIVSRHVESAIVLPAREMHEFIDLEIRSFGSLAVPYDIDHPIASVAGVDTDLFLRRLRMQHPNIVETTRRWQAAHGIRVYTIPLVDEFVSNHSLSEFQYGPAKIRIFVDSRDSSVKFVSIFCLALPDEILGRHDLFRNSTPGLEDIWSEMRLATERSQYSFERKGRALAYAAHYLAGIESLVLWMRWNRGAITKSPVINESDLRLLFGKRISQLMSVLINPMIRIPASSTVETWMEAASNHYYIDVGRSPRIDPVKEIAAITGTARGRIMMPAIGRYLRYSHFGLPSSAATLVFEAQREVYDLLTRSNTAADEARLDVGIPFAVIPDIISQRGAEISSGDFDTWCDAAVDGGSIVPGYGRSLSEPSIWIRTVRFGERGEQNLKHYIHYCVARAESAFKRRHSEKSPDPENPETVESTGFEEMLDFGEEYENVFNEAEIKPTLPDGVPWLLIEKALAVLIGLHSRRVSDEVDVPLMVGNDEFGARVEVDLESRRYYLTDWANESGVIEKSRSQITYNRSNGYKGTSTFVTASRSFEQTFPRSRIQLDPNLLSSSAQVIEAFVALDARLIGENRRNAILAISTCPNEESYLAAISKELSLWLTHPARGILRVYQDLVEIASDPGSTSRDLRTRITRNIAKSANFIGESRRKSIAYNSRLEMRDLIDAIFDEMDATDGSLAPVWQNEMRPLIRSDSSRFELDARYLSFAAEIAGKATSITRTILNNNGIATDRRPAAERQSLQMYIEQFNELIASADARGLVCGFLPDPVQFDELLELGTDSLMACAAVIQSAHNCVQDIYGSHRHPKPTSGWQNASRDWVVLMWDLMKSSTSGTQQGLEACVEDINRVVSAQRHELKGRGFVPSADDGNSCLFQSVSDSMKVAQKISEVAGARDYKVRLALETTHDRQKLRLYEQTQRYTGQAYQIARRMLDFFKEVSQDHNSTALDFAEPDASYLVVSDHGLKVLTDVESSSIPASMVVGRQHTGYRPRIEGALSIELTWLHFANGDFVNGDTVD